MLANWSFCAPHSCYKLGFFSNIVARSDNAGKVRVIFIVRGITDYFSCYVRHQPCFAFVSLPFVCRFTIAIVW